MSRAALLDSFVETLELLAPIGKTLPVVGNSVEGSLEAAVKVIKFAQVCMHDARYATPSHSSLSFCENVRKNREKTLELAAETSRWMKSLVEALKTAPPAQLPALQANVQEIRKSVIQLVLRLFAQPLSS
jgi:hypothetical protein